MKPRHAASRVRASRLFGAAIAGLAVLLLTTRVEAAPQRVVSMNLCTDQLVILLAAPSQVYSVSHLATGEQGSVLFEQAGDYVINHGLAEQIFLMKPDLIVAGTFSTRATVDMLRRLGFPVEEFAPASSFDDIRTNVRRMGHLLGREERAEALLAEMDAVLARAYPADSVDAIAGLYGANSVTSGAGTLVDDALGHAGLGNLGAELGISGTAKLPLEVLITHTPDILIGRSRWSEAPAMAYDAYDHPAMRGLKAGTHEASVPDKYWICGTPFTAHAVERLAEAAARLEADPQP